MRKRCKIGGLWVVVLLVVLSSVASAAPTTLVSQWSGGPNMISPSMGAGYQHDVTGCADYDPALVAGSGELEVWLSDTYFGNPYAVTVAYDGTNWNTCSVDRGTYMVNIVPGAIVNGCVQVQVGVSPVGYFAAYPYLRQSTLTLWCDYPGTGGLPGVPAPGAMVLAGMGTCLVGWLRRRSTL